MESESSISYDTEEQANVKLPIRSSSVHSKFLVYYKGKTKPRSRRARFCNEGANFEI